MADDKHYHFHPWPGPAWATAAIVIAAMYFLTQCHREDVQLEHNRELLKLSSGHR